MRLKSIHGRSIRGIRDHRIDFPDSGVTVVEGDNEVGKSTLFEAFDLLIEYTAESSALAIKNIRPTHTGADPEIAVEMTAGPYRFTYRKVFSEGRNAVTELVVTEPEPQTLHGRPAHDRVKEILAETTDLALGKALRINQREVAEQPALDGRPGLVQALDAAAGKGAGGSHGDLRNASLIMAVTAEFEQLFQPVKGKPRGEYAAAITELKQAETDRDARRQTVDRVAQLLEDHERAGALLAETHRETREHKPRLEALETRWAELTERAQVVKELEMTAAAVQREAADAARLASDRDALRAEANDAHLDAQQQAGDATVLKTAAATSQDLAESTETHAIQDANALRAASDAATQAAADRDHLRDLGDLEALTARCARVGSATSTITDAESALVLIRITPAQLAGIEEAHDAAIRAAATLEAASARLDIHALAAVTVQYDGTAHDLAAGITLPWRLSDDSTLVIDDRVRITAAVGSGERDLRRQSEDSARTLKVLCQQCGVADVVDARAQMDNRRRLEAERDAANSVLAAELSGATIIELQSRSAALTTRTRAYRDGRGPGALPAGMAEAEERVQSTGQATEQLRTAATVSAAVAAGAREAASTDNTAAAVKDHSATAAAVRAEQLRQRLAEAREKESDEELHSRAQEAGEAAREASDTWQTAVELHNADDPASVKAELDDERAIGQKLAKAIEDLRVQRIQLDAQLQSDRNAQEDYNIAAECHAAALRRHDSLFRRAEAVRLLHTTLTKTRDRAKREYVAPFRAKLEELASIVFGPTIRLEVNENLAIVSRTLHGAKVSFDQLSGGAQEQLAVCARLAAAALVDDDGAPVVIDDALGFTDPDRLRKLGRVFTAAQPRSQVIVLTCTPGRYRGIVDAHIRQLTRGGPTAGPAGE